MGDIAIKFLREWKDYKVGDITTVNDVMAAELIGSEIAENANRERQNDGVLSIGYHSAKLLGLRSRKVFMENQINLINTQIAFEEEYLSPKDEQKDEQKETKIKRKESGGK